ncbi:MAG: ATP-binding protein [Gordonia polyisoprenivorans]|nr:ATP-binding protein [Gordonia polyisoprenivorans]
MRAQPITAMTSNLRFTRSGVVWADFLLTGLDYHYARLANKNAVRKAHTMLARAIPGEALLLGLTADETPETIVRRMTTITAGTTTSDIDLDAHPAWAAECLATLNTIGEFRPGRRVYWLSVPLATKGFKSSVQAAGQAVWLSATDMLGVPHGAIPTQQIDRAARAAALVQAAIPPVFKPAPTTPAQAVWLWAHMLHRGLLADPDLPDPAHTPADKSGGALSAALLDEGALSDRPDTGPRSKLPTFDNVLKVNTPWEMNPLPPSYQVFSVVTDTPAGGTNFPGSELFTITDAALVGGAPVDVDFAIRLRTRAGTEVLKSNQRAVRNLNEQYHQREGEISTGHGILDNAAEALQEYTAQFEADKNEIEVAWSAVFAVSGPSAFDATEAARSLAKAFEQQDFRVTAPLGYQEQLFWSMVPGVPVATTRILNEFTQITTSHHFGAFVPVVGAHIGDPHGPLLGLNISTNVPTAVHYDVTRLVERDVSNSFATTGEMGGGKSKTIEAILGPIVDRGGQALIIDQSAMAEYVAWAREFAGHKIVDMVDAQYSVDPLIIFPGQEGADQAETILRALLRIPADDPRAITLAEVLSPEYRQQHPYTGTAGLVEHLLSGECAEPRAADIGKSLMMHARRTYAKALFGKDLPPLPINAPVIVFLTNRVSLPTRDEMMQKHLYENLPAEKHYGHVIYTHIANMAKGIMCSDRSRTSMLGCDEAAHLLTAADGIEIITYLVKQGRKENAGVALGDQDCDFGNDVLRGLIKTRIAHRHTDEHLARKALTWLGMDPDADNGKLLIEYMEETSPQVNGIVPPERRGEGYMRDAAGKFARIKILISAQEARQIAASTTPNAAPKAPVLTDGFPGGDPVELAVPAT